MKLSTIIPPIVLVTGIGCAPDLVFLAPNGDATHGTADAVTLEAATDTPVPDVPADAQGEASVSVDAADVPVDVGADVADAPDVTDVVDVTDAVEVSLPDVSEVGSGRDVTDVADVRDVASVSDVIDVTDTPDATDATDAADVPAIPVDLGPPPCLPGQDRCGGAVCRNLSTDPANCGACGNVCPTRPHALATCSGGSCVLVCEIGHLNCDGNLTNGCETSPATDVNNCGGCGMVCPSLPNTAPSMCMGGVCSFGCGAGYANCDGNLTNGCEVSTSTDPMNCGGCGRACGAGQTCRAGVCMCPTGWPACGGACPNQFTDVNNCGTCGVVCGTGNGCCNGYCRDFQNDSRNCGGCRVVCPGTSTCSAGRCVCPSGQTLCGTACVDRSSDSNNCGWCGHVCGATVRRCVNYQCVP